MVSFLDIFYSEAKSREYKIIVTFKILLTLWLTFWLSGEHVFSMTFIESFTIRTHILQSVFLKIVYFLGVHIFLWNILEKLLLPIILNFFRKKDLEKEIVIAILASHQSTVERGKVISEKSLVGKWYIIILNELIDTHKSVRWTNAKIGSYLTISIIFFIFCLTIGQCSYLLFGFLLIFNVFFCVLASWSYNFLSFFEENETVIQQQISRTKFFIRIFKNIKSELGQYENVNIEPIRNRIHITNNINNDTFLIFRYYHHNPLIGKEGIKDLISYFKKKEKREDKIVFLLTNIEVSCDIESNKLKLHAMPNNEEIDTVIEFIHEFHLKPLLKYTSPEFEDENDNITT